MKIRSIRAIGLSGATPEGGWTLELQSADSLHTLIVVETDEGRLSVGSNVDTIVHRDTESSAAIPV